MMTGAGIGQASFPLGWLAAAPGLFGDKPLFFVFQARLY
jgi:hypothetical protein